MSLSDKWAAASGAKKFALPGFCFAAIIGVQLHLAHQISEMIRGSNKQIAALRVTTESLADGVNRDIFDPQRQVRVLMRQMRQLNGKPFIVVIGDSITEAAPLPDAVCGIAIINAGIGGSRTSNFIPFAEELAHFKPALIVVALGINDTSLRIKTAFKEGYQVLLNSLPKVPVVLASLTPVDYTGPIGQRLDPERAKLVDNIIRSTAESRHFGFVDMGKLAGPDFQTLDGVHLGINANALWVSAVLDGITRALSCGGQSPNPPHGP
jgi:lysophospholipase L1-like esterase